MQQGYNIAAEVSRQAQQGAVEGQSKTCPALLRPLRSHGVLCHAVLCCDRSGPDAAPEDLPGTISQLMSSALTSGDLESAAYWAYHLARTGFFTATVSHTHGARGAQTVCRLSV
jgi:hypothetical protein